MRNITSRIYLICTLVFIFSCSEEIIRKVGLRGTLTGYVVSYNSAGAVAPLANAIITLEGTDPMISVYTDANGKFKVTDLETGTYHIRFSKPGYGTYKTLGYPFVGGDVPANVTAALYELPEIQIMDVNATLHKSGSNVSLQGTIFTDDPETAAMTIVRYRYYLSNQADLSPNRYMETGIMATSYSGNAVSFTRTINLKRFPSGSDLYLQIYPCSDETSSYLDLDTGNKIYTSLGEYHSDVIKLKVPN